ncbi:MAG: hypothetical protein U0T75_04925 [Chitinophagales bacterium]
MEQPQYSKFYQSLRKVFINLPGFEAIYERIENSPLPAEPFIYSLFGVMVLPAMLAIVLTMLEVYPATIAIHWLANKYEIYSFKMAAAVNIVAFMLAAFVIALPILIIYRLSRR